MPPNKVTDQKLSSPSQASKSNKFQAFIGALVITALIGAAFLLFKRAILPYQTAPAVRLSQLINEDLENLNSKNALPAEFKSIREIEITTEGSTFKPITDDLDLKTFTQANGKHILQVFVFFYIDGYKYGANVQYDLVEIDSNNTLWEAVRSYELGLIF